MAMYAIDDRLPSVHSDAYVHPDAVIIGDVRIGAQASVWPGAVLRGDRGTIHIGARTSVQDGAVIHCTAELDTIIGSDCVIGHCAHIEGAVVEDGSLIGSGAVVLQRARIGSGAIVAAAALVPPGTEVPARATALGVPARIRPESADPDVIAHAVSTYIDNARWYAGLRRLDP